MRLSLSQLEAARKRPGAFAAAQLGTFSGIRPTFFSFWVFAAKWYHKLLKDNDPRSAEKAHDYLLQHCRAKLSNDPDFDTKLAFHARKLDEYIASHAALNQPTVQTNKRVLFKNIPGHLVSGVVGRLDIVPTGGFAATNFTARRSNWQKELRTAIIQYSLAEELRRPLSEISVGMYCIEAGDHDYVCLSDTAVNKAVQELGNVLNRVDAEIKRLRRAKS